jgi:Ca2+/H+ antiporter
MHASTGWSTPEDAAATVTLLRAPAAIAAFCFLGGAVAAQVAWFNWTLEGAAFAVLRCLAVALVCVPFLLPSRRYRSGQTGMRVWLIAAAVLASLRTVYLCVSLFPLPLVSWLLGSALQLALLSTLWLAVYVLRPPTTVPRRER